ncbi:rhamnosyltransferase WsaF family glycosyltransferase [Spiribacter pallidus]|uniref:rhamnosyltransferase WsaF family glycosyltransferase n=1 Tax=Spiribacter pallidus TaxID=1987936 RepID=UPI0034A050A7
MLKPLLRYLLLQHWLQRWLRAIYGNLFEEISRIRHARPEVGEIDPLPAVRRASSRRRVTLLLPGLSRRHYFGGIATAMGFLEGFRGQVDDLRIVVTDEASLDAEEHARFSDWRIAGLGEEDAPGNVIIPAGGREAPLAMRPDECVIATAWWTAHLAAELTTKAPFIYLIQDFEPGFYPWSSRYALAEQTYRSPQRIVPVCNSTLLRDFMAGHGYLPADALAFEPVINETLAATIKADPCSRERRVLVYGRPTVERNAFAVVVDVLRRLVAHGRYDDWAFISVGEPHADIDLGRGCRLQSRGKLKLDEYAAELRRAHAGLSLMVSPHPSYPPLEMAAAGLQVVTNRYANKDPQAWSNRVSAPAPGDLRGLTDALARALDAYTAEPVGMPHAQDLLAYYQAHTPSFSSLAEAVWQQWQEKTGSVASD